MSSAHVSIVIISLSIHGVLIIVTRIDQSTLNTMRIENIFYRFCINVARVKSGLCFKCHCIRNWFRCCVEHSAKRGKQWEKREYRETFLFPQRVHCLNRLILNAFTTHPRAFFNCIFQRWNFRCNLLSSL